MVGGRRSSFALLVAFLVPCFAAAQAPRIRVVASNGVRAALEELRPECERVTGSPLAVELGTTAGLQQRIEAGEAFDVAILTSQAMEDLSRKGSIVSDSGSELARSGIGVGVRRGASRPEIGTPDQLKRALLATKSVTYAGDGASRVHIEAMLERLGIAEEVGRKTTLEQGSARAMARVAEARTELVMTLVSEILPAPGIELLGPLPAELQHEVGFRPGVSARSANKETAEALIRCLAGPTAARAFLARGMEPRSADRFLEVNGLRIHYLDWGAAGKQPLILLHGIGRVAHTFDHVVSHFNESYHVMALDLRGHGESGWDPEGAYLVEDYVEDIVRFVDALSLRNIVVWGNSTGGRVAQVFAGMRPDLVAAVIVEDVGPERPREIANNVTTRIRKEDETGWASEEELFGELKAANPRTAEEVLRALAHYGSKRRPDGRVIWKRDPGIAKGFVPTELWKHVERITSPILYIVGGRSTIVPPEIQERLRLALPQVRIETLPETGHYPSEERPREYLEIVDRFLIGSLSDPYDGTWVLNLARSGGEARTQTLTIQIAGGREIYRSELVAADGRRQVTTYSAAYDGEEYPSQTVTASSSGEIGPPRRDTVILKKVDERTRERHWMQGGRLVRILRRVVSPDGRILTSQVIDVDEHGRETLSSTLIFDKR
jgi:pimeloyl-ACP methyl ester carboxylesterase/ABC-type molybdate transport system substrate-binding protein